MDRTTAPPGPQAISLLRRGGAQPLQSDVSCEQAFTAVAALHFARVVHGVHHGPQASCERPSCLFHATLNSHAAVRSIAHGHMDACMLDVPPPVLSIILKRAFEDDGGGVRTWIQLALVCRCAWVLALINQSGFASRARLAMSERLQM